MSKTKNDKNSKIPAGQDNEQKRDPNLSSSSTFQKRESESRSREDVQDTKGAAGSRGTYVRGNMDDMETDYDTRNMGRQNMQSEFGSGRGTDMMHWDDTSQRAHVGRSYESSRGGHEDSYHRGRDYDRHRESGDYSRQSFNHREDDRRSRDTGYYGGPYSGERQRDQHPYEQERGRDRHPGYREERFPEDSRYYEYNRQHRGRMQDDHNRGYGYGNNEGTRYRGENQGQYSADNYDTPMRRRGEPRGGMNYEGGRSEGYEPDYGHSRRNYDGPSGGYNEERNRDTYHQRHSPYRDQSRYYEGEGNQPGNYRRDDSYFNDPERENRRRNRQENDSW
jgi:hypothetical protein